MTRDEAIVAIHTAHHPEDLPGSMKWDVNRGWAEKAVNGYIALGMLKLDEPKSVDERVYQALVDVSIGLRTCDNIQRAFDGAGLRIVEK